VTTVNGIYITDVWTTERWLADADPQNILELPTDNEYLCSDPLLITARSSYADAVLGIVILSVCPSVCLSVTRVLCDETKEHTADILIPLKGVITLAF